MRGDIVFLSLILFFIDGASGQLRSTWPTWAGPGDCGLEYDGSKVPDCGDFLDPVSKQPYYHQHSSSKRRQVSSEISYSDF